MRSCIVLFYFQFWIYASGTQGPVAGPQMFAADWTHVSRQDQLVGAPPGTHADEADALYADRTNLDNARRAAGIWREELRHNPAAFDAAWKLARADYWLGRHVPRAERRNILERGIDAARAAAALRPGRPEGHFWAAANMGELAESFGRLAGLRYRAAIKEELDTVLRVDPAFEQGSADRALGRWYFKVPAFLGGSRALAEQHLRASLAYNGHSTASHFFLAELFLDEGRNRDARTELQAVIEAPLDPRWAPEDREFQAQARSLLVRVKASP